MSYLCFLEYPSAKEIIFVKNSPANVAILTTNCTKKFSKEFSKEKSWFRSLVWWNEIAFSFIRKKTVREKNLTRFELSCEVVDAM